MRPTRFMLLVLVSPLVLGAGDCSDGIVAPPTLHYEYVAGSYSGPVSAPLYTPADTLNGTLTLHLTQSQKTGDLQGTFEITGTLTGGASSVPVSFIGTVDGHVSSGPEGWFNVYLREDTISTCSHALWGNATGSPPHLFIEGGFIYQWTQAYDCPSSLHGANVSPSELLPQ